MNVFTGYGRLVKDVEIIESNGKSRVVFSVAIPRNYRDATGETQSDFINCVSFNENVVKYLPQFSRKGHRIAFSGRLQINSSKNADGTFSNFTNVLVNEVTYVETKKESDSTISQNETANIPPNKTPKKQKPQVEIASPDDLPF